MIFFIGFTVIHALIFLWVLFHWKSIPEIVGLKTSKKTFSILIPVRNEEKNITELLMDIENQTYPKSLFEVIVIDDHSDDRTKELILSAEKRVSYALSYLHNGDRMGKKAAVELGVAAAKNEYILVTDGDCRLASGWIEAYAAEYESETAVMLTGPVSMEGNGLLASLQSVEFASLIGFGAAALHSGNPSMCNGANMSYRRDVFLEVDGYAGNSQIPSGDDEFLLQKVFSKYPDQIRFLKNKKAIVHTPAKESFGALFNQRVRWSSKWQYHKSWFVKFSAVYIFIDFLVLILAGFTAFFGIFSWQVFLIFFFLRCAVDSVYMLSVKKFFNNGFVSVFSTAVLLQIIYPVFVSLLGIASIFGKYSWKGRNY